MTRIIKRYRNRKLYDTEGKKYIRLNDIAEMVKQNEKVRVIDNENGSDITHNIFTRIILKSDSPDRAIPLETMKTWISQSEATLKRAVKKTFEFGRGFAGLTGRDMIGSKEEEAQSLAGPDGLAEGFFQRLERTVDGMIEIANRNLRERLLRFPRKEQWRKLNEKLDLLECKINLLTGGNDGKKTG